MVVEHRPGLKHTNADALSRRPCRVCERQERLSTEAVKEQYPDEAVNLEETVRFCPQVDLTHDDPNIVAIRDISSDPIDNRPQVL